MSRPTLVVINAGAISFEQGAALVIGMDVGTTVTAAVATVGATRRRPAHRVFARDLQPA